MTISAIILAGGQSSRMGQDKALLMIEGRPLLLRVCQVALHCTPEVRIVTAWPERYQPLVPDSCQFIQEIPHAHYQGPVAGFVQGLAEVQTDWVLLLACDLPYLEAPVLQQWSQQLAVLPSTTVAFLPRQAQGWEPLCGFYRSHCRAALTEYLEQGGRSFQGWLETQSVAAIAPPPSPMLFNCNTLEDLAQLPSETD